VAAKACAPAKECRVAPQGFGQARVRDRVCAPAKECQVGPQGFGQDKAPARWPGLAKATLERAREALRLLISAIA
jgi:hypothetical protein